MKSIKETIIDLAKKNNVVYEETLLDKFANKLSELSDKDVGEDQTINTLVALKRKKVISKKEFLNFLHGYVKEKNYSTN